MFAPGSTIRLDSTPLLFGGDSLNPESGALPAAHVSYSPESFAANYNSARSCVDVFWALFFLVNLIVSIILFIVGKSWNPYPSCIWDCGIDLLVAWIALGSAAFISFLAFLAFILFPRSIIRRWLLFGLFPPFGGAMLLLASFVMLVIRDYVFLSHIFIYLLTMVLVPFLIFKYFICPCFLGLIRPRSKFSSEVSRASAEILRRYPSSYLFTFAMFLLQCAVAYCFAMGSLTVYARSLSSWLYLYIAFSYFWIQSTINFIAYRVLASLGIVWYFLNNTPHMPKFPLLQSIGRTVTSGFGPVALAGLVDGLFSLFPVLQRKLETDRSGPSSLSNAFGTIGTVVSRFSLIYSVMFGVSASVGAKRWSEQTEENVVSKVANAMAINSTVRCYSWSSFLLAMALAGFPRFDTPIAPCLQGDWRARWCFWPELCSKQ
jgi:hypothetical protein